MRLSPTIAHYLPNSAGHPMRINVAALLLAVLGLVVVSPTHSEQIQLVDFEIKDQFKNVHRRPDIQGKIVLLIGSEKDGSQFNEAWGKSIHNSLSDHPQYARISLLAHADLRGVPFFLKGYVRGKFPRNPDQYVLMVWKGAWPTHTISLPSPPMYWCSHQMEPWCTTDRVGNLAMRRLTVF